MESWPVVADYVLVCLGYEHCHDEKYQVVHYNHRVVVPGWDEKEHQWNGNDW